MKPTQEQIHTWAIQAGFEEYESTSLSGNSELDRTLQVGEYPVGECVFALVSLAYEAGQRDERNRIIHIGLQGFGGDACDFAEWLCDENPHQNTNSV